LKKLGYKEIPDLWIEKVTDLSEEQKKEFIIKDNAHWGSEWDFDLLEEWKVDLEDWGIETEDTRETAKLSELKFESIYYTPVEIPNISLKDCINTDKFDAKIKIIEDSDLSDEQKEIMKLFAYRFIKIDFESVANYYYFNANDEEKKVMERLRLVLCDSGIDGFIEDDLLKIYNDINGWNGIIDSDD